MFYAFKENLLSEQKCQNLIAQAKNIGFLPSKVNIYGKMTDASHIRNNKRIEYTDAHLAQELQELILKNFQSELLTFKNQSFAGLNEYFRFYHYSPGEFFKPHKDGKIKLENKTSLITVLFYLNDTLGGETILMPNGYSNKDSWIYVTPTKGSVLLFEHEIWHEGKEIKSGEKIVLRSDLFYS